MHGQIARGKAGYSLIEVVVVMALIAILTGIAALSLGDYLPMLRLKRAGQELQLQIQKARLEAVRQNRFCCVEFHKQVGGNRFAPIVWIEEDGDSVLETGEEVVFRQGVDGGTFELDNYGGIRFDTTRGGGDGVTFAGNVFRFNSRGISDKDGSIYLKSSSGRNKEIKITLGGAIRII